MSKVDLARKIELTPRRLWTFESGEEAPAVEVVHRLAKVLNVTPAFFDMETPTEVTPDGVSFRSFARLTAGQRGAALAATSIAFEVANAVERVLDFPAVDLPDIRSLDPETAAQALRSEWALGRLPLPNAVHLVEAHGCRVFSLVDDVAALDAFALWNRNRPFIFLTSRKSAERSRWDLCHELAHLLLHVGAVPQGKETESEADVFAGEFLMPSDGVRERAHRWTSMREVSAEKRYWRVSALAYIRRLRQLDVIGTRTYKSLAIEATQAGYRKHEDEIERDLSGLWPKAIALLAEDGVSIADIARSIGVYPGEVRELIFSGLAAVVGDKDESVPTIRPELRVVE